jgi:hypothetical protein
MWYENPSWTRHTITSGVSGLFVGPIGDLDQDGDPDVVFGGQNDIGWCENLGDAQNWQRHVFDTVNNQYPTPVRLADLNSDGYLDVTAYTLHNPTTSTGDARWYANPLMPTTVDNNRAADLPSKFALLENYPNPFNPSTVIQYAIPKAVRVKLTIYNVLGEKIRTLVDSYKPAGIKQVLWDGRNELGQRVASGVYLYRLEAGEFTKTRRLVVMR